MKKNAFYFILKALFFLKNSKGKQTIKFGQLIEFYERNIFLQKIIQKMTQGN